MAGLASNLLSLATLTFWRQKYASWRARRFDRRNGIETSQVVPVSEILDVDQSLASHAVHYEPSTLPKFERAMRAVAIDHSRYTFIDYGSGKGRVLLLAAQYPFRRVIGVEMSAALNAVAAANIESYGQRNRLASGIELVCADAREYAVPDGDAVAYFYNPFDERVMRDVRDRLLQDIAMVPRSLVVIYVNPLHRQLFDEARTLTIVRDEPALVVYRGGISERPS